jgi:hypothetical protein
MGEFFDTLPNELVLNCIWPKLCKIYPWEERYKMLLTLHLCNKSWKQLIDNSEDVQLYGLQMVEVKLDKAILEECLWEKHNDSYCGLKKYNLKYYWTIENLTWIDSTWLAKMYIRVFMFDNP